MRGQSHGVCPIYKTYYNKSELTKPDAQYGRGDGIAFVAGSSWPLFYPVEQMKDLMCIEVRQLRHAPAIHQNRFFAADVGTCSFISHRESFSPTAQHFESHAVNSVDGYDATWVFAGLHPTVKRAVQPYTLTARRGWTDLEISPPARW